MSPPRTLTVSPASEEREASLSVAGPPRDSVDLEATNKDGWTALWYAERAKHQPVIKALRAAKKAGVDSAAKAAAAEAAG